MCGSAPSAVRVSRAALWSLKASAAVLLAPMISARVRRWLVIARRNMISSYVPKAVPARSKATLLVSIMISVSLRLMETSRKVRRRMLIPVAISDDCGQLEQLRTELQSRSLRDIHIDFKTYLVFFLLEMDNPPARAKTFLLATRNNIPPLQDPHTLEQ